MIFTGAINCNQRVFRLPDERYKEEYIDYHNKLKHISFQKRFQLNLKKIKQTA